MNGLDLFFDADEGLGVPDTAAIEWLCRNGATISAVASPWAVRVALVRFELSGRYVPAGGLGDFAFVLPIVSGGEIIDVAAWCPASGRVATRLGLGAMLGQDELDVEGAGSTGAALRVWRDPLGWLRAGRRGLVVVDKDQSARLLAGLTLRAEDDAHARTLRRLLRLPSPVILSTFAERAAA